MYMQLKYMYQYCATVTQLKYMCQYFSTVNATKIYVPNTTQL